MTEKEKVDIKNILEALEGVAVFGVAIIEIVKDGIGWDDVAKLKVLLTEKRQALHDAVDAAGDIPAEVMDIDGLEGAQITAKVLDIVARFKAAL